MHISHTLPARLAAKAWQHGNRRILYVHSGVGVGGTTIYTRTAEIVRHNRTALNVSAIKYIQTVDTSTSKQSIPARGMSIGRLGY